MGPSGRIGYIAYIGLFGTDKCRLFTGTVFGLSSPYKGETLPDFLKWCWVTRHPLIFRGLTGSQRTPGFGASQN